MHCELGKVLIYPEICTLIYSDFPSGASGILLERVLGIGVGTGVGTPAGVDTTYRMIKILLKYEFFILFNF